MFAEATTGHLIVLEEDLEIAPDFFAYFEATLPLLQSDPCLFCVSAWNDNGKPEVASDTRAIYRTDFFPGLGWMLGRTFWLEIRDRWPLEYWDDFVRRSDVRRGRHCLRPEVSRTHTFGEVGVSNGQFYHAHLRGMALNTDPVNWTAMDLGFVSSPARFDEFVEGQVAGAEAATLQQLGRPDNVAARRKLVLRYSDADWLRYAKFFGFMEDMKDGIRRGTYRGVLAFTWRDQHVFLVRDWPLSG